MERRSHPRFEVKLRVLSDDLPTSSGLLVNLSQGGAFVANPSSHPAVGRLVGLRTNAAGRCCNLVGVVVRYDHEGFAIRFDPQDAATRVAVQRLLELTAAEP